MAANVTENEEFKPFVIHKRPKDDTDDDKPKREKLTFPPITAEQTGSVDDINTVPSAQRIKFLLEKMGKLKSTPYFDHKSSVSSDDDNKPSSDDVSNEIIDSVNKTFDENNYSITNLLDDFHDLKYGKGIDSDDALFDVAFDYFKDIITESGCDIDQCPFVERHYMDRGRRRRDDDHKENERDDLLMDTLSMIHCYFLHSHDTTRFTKKERDRILKMTGSKSWKSVTDAIAGGDVANPLDDDSDSDSEDEKEPTMNALIMNTVTDIITAKKRRGRSRFRVVEPVDDEETKEELINFTAMAQIVGVDEVVMKEGLSEYGNDRNQLIGDLIDAVYGENAEDTPIWNKLKTEKDQKEILQKLLYGYFKNVHLNTVNMLKISEYIIGRKGLEIDMERLEDVVESNGIDGRMFDKKDSIHYQNPGTFKKRFKGAPNCKQQHVNQLYGALRKWKYVETKVVVEEAEDDEVKETEIEPKSDKSEAQTKDHVARSGSAKPGIYAIGRPFLFWKSMQRHRDYVKAKYSSMKEEVLQCPLLAPYFGGSSEWDKLEAKVKFMVKTKAAKQVMGNGLLRNRYGIEKKDAFDVLHLCALKLYTDYTKLCSAFCSILRRGEPEEVAQIANWARLLIETVQCFGSPLINESAGKTYYRGVDTTFMFTAIDSRFNLPQSTTSDRLQAIDFAEDGSGGLVLKLGQSQSKRATKVMKFECELFSCFPEEKETLFYGGETYLRIKGMMQWKMGKWKHYDKYMDAVDAFNKLITDISLKEHPIHDKPFTQIKMNRIIKDHLQFELSSSSKSLTPEYIRDLVSHQIVSREHIRLNFNEMMNGVPWMRYLLKSSDDSNLLNIANIAILFRHSVAITLVVSGGYDLEEDEWESVVQDLGTIQRMGLSMAFRFQLSSNEDGIANMLQIAMECCELNNSPWQCNRDRNVLFFKLSDDEELKCDEESLGRGTTSIMGRLDEVVEQQNDEIQKMKKMKQNTENRPSVLVKVTRFDVLKQYLKRQHDAEEKEIEFLSEMVLDNGYESDTLQLSEDYLALNASPWNQMQCARFIPSFFRTRKLINGKFESGFQLDLSSVSVTDPKPNPGLHFHDKYPDRKDPRGQPDFVEFEWNSDIMRLQDCDTVHLLYLLQLSCEVHRQWVIGRNQYFASISRSDRFLDHVDAPQLISNLLRWHNEDQIRNVFDGALLQSKDGMLLIRKMLVDVGKIREGSATKIQSILRQEVVIDREDWIENGNSTMKMFTWGSLSLHSLRQTLLNGLEILELEDDRSLHFAFLPNFENLSLEQEQMLHSVLASYFRQISRLPKIYRQYDASLMVAITKLQNVVDYFVMMGEQVIGIVSGHIDDEIKIDEDARSGSAQEAAPRLIRNASTKTVSSFMNVMRVLKSTDANYCVEMVSKDNLIIRQLRQYKANEVEDVLRQIEQWQSLQNTNFLSFSNQFLFEYPAKSIQMKCALHLLEQNLMEMSMMLTWADPTKEWKNLDFCIYDVVTLDSNLCSVWKQNHTALGVDESIYGIISRLELASAEQQEQYHQMIMDSIQELLDNDLLLNEMDEEVTLYSLCCEQPWIWAIGDVLKFTHSQLQLVTVDWYTKDGDVVRAIYPIFGHLPFIKRVKDIPRLFDVVIYEEYLCYVYGINLKAERALQLNIITCNVGNVGNNKCLTILYSKKNLKIVTPNISQWKLLRKDTVWFLPIYLNDCVIRRGGHISGKIIKIWTDHSLGFPLLHVEVDWTVPSAQSQNVFIWLGIGNIYVNTGLNFTSLEGKKVYTIQNELQLISMECNDRVSRGHDWDKEMFENQDGHGLLGKVSKIEIEPAEHAGCEIDVIWDNEMTYNYRFGLSSKFDVEIIQRTSRVRQLPLLYCGDIVVRASGWEWDEQDMAIVDPEQQLVAPQIGIIKEIFSSHFGEDDDDEEEVEVYTQTARYYITQELNQDSKESGGVWENDTLIYVQWIANPYGKGVEEGTIDAFDDGTLKYEPRGWKAEINKDGYKKQEMVFGEKYRFGFAGEYDVTVVGPHALISLGYRMEKGSNEILFDFSEYEKQQEWSHEAALKNNDVLTMTFYHKNRLLNAGKRAIREWDKYMQNMRDYSATQWPSMIVDRLNERSKTFITRFIDVDTLIKEKIINLHCDEVETQLEHCAVEDVITLFTFVNEEEKFDDDVAPKDTVNGAFAWYHANAKGAMVRVVAIDGWKEKVIEWIRDEQVDGNKLRLTTMKELISTLRSKLEPNDPQKALGLTGPCGCLLNFAKKMPAYKVLMAAKAHAGKVEIGDIKFPVRSLSFVTMHVSASDSDSLDYEAWLRGDDCEENEAEEELIPKAMIAE